MVEKASCGGYKTKLTTCCVFAYRMTSQVIVHTNHGPMQHYWYTWQLRPACTVSLL